MPDIWYPNASFPAGEVRGDVDPHYLERFGSRSWVYPSYGDIPTGYYWMHLHSVEGSGNTWPSNRFGETPVGTFFWENGPLWRNQFIDQDFFGWTMHEDYFPRCNYSWSINTAYQNLVFSNAPTTGGANLYSTYGGNPYNPGADSWFDVATPAFPDSGWRVQDTNPYAKADIWGEIISLRIPTLGLDWTSESNLGAMSATVRLRWDLVTYSESPTPFDNQVSNMTPWTVLAGGSVLGTATLSGADSALKWSVSDVVIPLNLSRTETKAIYESGPDQTILIQAELLSDTIIDYVPAAGDYTGYFQQFTTGIVVPDGAYYLVKPENVDVLYTVDAIPDLAGDLTGERQRFS